MPDNTLNSLEFYTNISYVYSIVPKKGKHIARFNLTSMYGTIIVCILSSKVENQHINNYIMVLNQFKFSDDWKTCFRLRLISILKYSLFEATHSADVRMCLFVIRDPLHCFVSILFSSSSFLWSQTFHVSSSFEKTGQAKSYLHPY